MLMVCRGAECKLHAECPACSCRFGGKPERRPRGACASGDLVPVPFFIVSICGVFGHVASLRRFGGPLPWTALGLAVAAAGLLAGWRPRYAVPCFVIGSVALVAQTVAGLFDGGPLPAPSAGPGGG